MANPARRTNVTSLRRCSALLGAVVLLALSGGTASGQVFLVSPNTTVDLTGETVSDEDVAGIRVGARGFRATIPVALPASVAVTGYHELPDGAIVFSVGSMVNLPGSLFVTPRDVVVIDGEGFSLALDGEDEGIPAGARIDAVSVDPTGSVLLLSFDTMVRLPGGVQAADEDIVAWTGVDFALLFDGSEHGVAAALDIDGVHLTADGGLLVSFQTGGAVGGVVFADEDILGFDEAKSQWSMILDVSTVKPTLAATDVEAIAVPEGSRIAMQAAALAALFLLRRVGRPRS